jgi:hypothetical protein
MTFNAEEKELLIFGLQMRKHYIETGDAMLSAADAKNMGRESKIKSLSDEQYELIVKLNNLIKKVEKT